MSNLDGVSIRMLVDREKQKQLAELSEGVRSAQADAAQGLREYQQLKQADNAQALEGIHESVVQVLGGRGEASPLHQELGIDPGPANAGVIAKAIQDRKLPVSANSIREVVTSRGVGDETGQLIPMQPLSDEEVRSQCKALIREFLVASPEEKARELSTYDARMAASREEISSRRHTGAYLVTTASMLQRVANLAESKRLRSLSVRELRAEARRSVEPHGYEVLPASFTPYQIASMTPAQIQEALRKYGVDQINAQIAAQKAAGAWKGVQVTPKNIGAPVAHE